MLTVPQCEQFSHGIVELIRAVDFDLDCAIVVLEQALESTPVDHIACAQYPRSK